MQHGVTPKSGKKINMEEERSYYELYLLHVSFSYAILGMLNKALNK